MEKEALWHERYLFGQGVILRLAIGTKDGDVHTEDLADCHGCEFAGIVRRHSRRVALRGVSRRGPLNRQRLPHGTLDRGCCGSRGDTTSDACRSQNAAKLGAGWRRRSLPMCRSSGTPPSTHVRGLLCRSEAYHRPTHAQCGPVSLSPGRRQWRAQTCRRGSCGQLWVCVHDHEHPSGRLVGSCSSTG